eukprot:Nk52_evm30s233 gene=Nk52_evmTU30s233
MEGINNTLNQCVSLSKSLSQISFNTPFDYENGIKSTKANDHDSALFRQNENTNQFQQIEEIKDDISSKAKNQNSENVIPSNIASLIKSTASSGDYDRLVKAARGIMAKSHFDLSEVYGGEVDSLKMNCQQTSSAIKSLQMKISRMNNNNEGAPDEEGEEEIEVTTAREEMDRAIQDRQVELEELDDMLSTHEKNLIELDEKVQSASVVNEKLEKLRSLRLAIEAREQQVDCDSKILETCVSELHDHESVLHSLLQEKQRISDNGNSNGDPAGKWGLEGSSSKGPVGKEQEEKGEKEEEEKGFNEEETIHLKSTLKELKQQLESKEHERHQIIESTPELQALQEESDEVNQQLAEAGDNCVAYDQQINMLKLLSQQYVNYHATEQADNTTAQMVAVLLDNNGEMTVDDLKSAMMTMGLSSDNISTAIYTLVASSVVKIDRSCKRNVVRMC